MYVCMHVCTYVFVYLCMYLCIYYLCIYVFMYSFTQQLHSKQPCPGFFQLTSSSKTKLRWWWMRFSGLAWQGNNWIVQLQNDQDGKHCANTCGGRAANDTMIHSIVRLKYQWYTGYHRIMFCLICKGNFLSTCFQDQFPGGLRSGYSHTTPPNLPSTRWTFHIDASESLVVNQISLIVCPITFHKFHTSQVVFFRFLLNNSTNITSILKNKLKWFTFNLPLHSYFSGVPWDWLQCFHQS